MPIQEISRAILGLRAAGWSEKAINDSFFGLKPETPSIGPPNKGR